MIIRPDSSIEPRPGDFASRVEAGGLVVPERVARFARAAHLNSAEELAGYAEAFPSTVAASLGWAAPSVVTAVRRLQAQLLDAGVVSVSAKPVRRSYGFGR